MMVRTESLMFGTPIDDTVVLATRNPGGPNRPHWEFPIPRATTDSWSDGALWFEFFLFTKKEHKAAELVTTNPALEGGC
jgi:hypothetical protein